MNLDRPDVTNPWAQLEADPEFRRRVTLGTEQLDRGKRIPFEARRPDYLMDWVGPNEFAFRQREWRRLVAAAFCIGIAVGCVVGVVWPS